MEPHVSRPTALILRAPGTNRDLDVAFALDLAGAEPVIATMAEAGERTDLWREARIVVVAGGFSYADSLGAGLLLGHELSEVLGDRFRGAVDAGRPVIGICNGFQALVRSGLLPGGGFDAALGGNAGGHFQCRWVRLRPVSRRSIWTRALDGGIDCPIAHGEGRFVCDDDTAARLAADDRIALTYTAVPGGPAEPNPNGSTADIAGICDETGLVLGLMPHPENHVLDRQHPLARRGGGGNLGLHLFEAGVRHAKEL